MTYGHGPYVGYPLSSYFIFSIHNASIYHVIPCTFFLPIDQYWIIITNPLMVFFDICQINNVKLEH